jgi:quercetin dioxygenase-like cupin family protein
MNQGHIKSGEVVNLETLKGDMDVDASYALVKTDDMEVIRMAVHKGKTTDEHSIEGEMSVQCLKGNILFVVDGNARDLTPGDWLYLKKKQNFSYSVKEDTILLITILFTNKS